MVGSHLPLRVPKRNHNEQEPDRDLDEVGDSPGHVVRRLVETHSVACPECDERSELITKLRHSADEATAEQPRRALCDVQVRGDVDAAEAQSCDETAEDQDAERVGNRLNDTVWCQQLGLASGERGFKDERTYTPMHMRTIDSLNAHNLPTQAAKVPPRNN